MTDRPKAFTNRLLELVSPKEARALKPHLESKILALQQIIYEPNKPIEHVYFVTHGVVSLVKKLDTGETIEIATVGPEGMVGTTLALGSETTDNRAITI